MDMSDVGRTVRVGFYGYNITHGHRVGGSDSFEPEITLDFAFHDFSAVEGHKIGIAGVAYN